MKPGTLEILNDFFTSLLETSNIATKKKLQMQIHGGTTFLATPVSKYGQKLTFDLKVVETPLFNQNERN